ncbi:MAG: thiamine phosphate synthase [Armatimonadota bacterium]|nr:MAG: thiamine phosphate synthase [Armatimonadota bacterium]
MLDFSLCAITRRVERLSRGHLEVARAALQGGVRMIQFRDKSLLDRELYEVAREMKRLAHESRAALIVNDRPDIALATGADGVHLGQEDVPIEAARRILGGEAVIGASVADPSQAREAEEQGASYVSVGSVFATTSKADAGEPIGIAPIIEIKRATRLPVIAIGGISLDNVVSVIRAGADGVAVISAVAEAEDMVVAASEFRRLIAEARRWAGGQEQSDDTA